MFKPLLTVLIVSFLSAPNAEKLRHLPRAPQANECFSGKWGNDFLLCGKDHVGKPGKGDNTKRKDQELLLQFKGNNKGEFSFYDCQNGKRFSEGIQFDYAVSGDTLKFDWNGDASQKRRIHATFNFRSSYRYVCKNDTLKLVDGLMKNTMYNGATYFVRRN